MRQQTGLFLALILFATTPFSPLFAAPEADFPAFTSGEHATSGDQIVFRVAPGDLGVRKVLHLKNGLALSYGDIAALGDFFGTPGYPITKKESKEEQRALFKEAFNALSEESRSVDEVTKILEVVHEEQSLVKAALDEGRSVQAVYKAIADDNNRRYNCITGGGCDGVWWMQKGRYLKLAEMDYDHFGSDAFAAYKIGHQLAIEEALKAHSTHDLLRLETAYAMNAFASHFLGDYFSAGHMRTPRVELNEKITPSFVGALLSYYMHAEENEYGLHVHNLRGDRWVAYGDAHYFDNANKQHRALMLEALQVSADQIYEAYLDGVARDPHAVTNIVPTPDSRGAENGFDISPLFYWDKPSQQFLRRVDMENHYDRHFTSSWWGWSTLTELSENRGLPNHLQAMLANSPYHQAAIQAGLVR